MIYDFYINNTKIDDVLEFTYTEDLEDVATSFSFSALHDYGITQNDKLNCVKLCEKGKTKPFYFGFITDCEHTTDVNRWQYSGFDVGFYLVQNEVITQFRNANIGDAIKSLCDDFSITLDRKPAFTQKVSKIYKDVVFSDILKELIELEKTKGGLKDVYIDCKSGNLQIKQYQIEKDLSSLIADKVLINARNTINAVTVKHSMQNLKNKVIYSNNDEKSIKRVGSQDNKSIAKYGLLQAVETIDTKKQNNLKKLSLSKLSELNKESEEISFSMLANPIVGKGKLVYFDIKEYGLKDVFLLTKCEHKIDNQKHEVSINIKRFN